MHIGQKQNYILHKLHNKLSTNPKIVQSLLNISGIRQLKGDKKLLSFLVANTKTHTLMQMANWKKNLHLEYCRAKRITVTKAVL